MTDKSTFAHRIRAAKLRIKDYDLDGTDPQRLPNTDTGDGAPSWSPF